MTSTTASAIAVAVGLGCAASAQASLLVYQNNFDTPATVAAGFTASLTGGGIIGTAVGPGFAPSAIANRVLSNSTGSLSSTPIASSLSIASVAGYNAGNVSFDLAFVGSWDSPGGIPVGSPDFFQMWINSSLALSTTCNNGSGPASACDPNAFPLQINPIGIVLLPGPTLLGGVVRTLHVSQSFSVIPSSSLNFDWRAAGAGWQGGRDESWAIDNIKIELNSVPEPGGLALAGAALVAAGMAGRRRSGPKSGAGSDVANDVDAIWPDRPR